MTLPNRYNASMRIELDYNIVSAEDRCAATHSIPETTLRRATSRDLEKVANYILYGKSQAGNPLPEAKGILAKHSTWRKKEPESLDSLMENVLFDEQTLRPANTRSPYTNPKPTIDKSRDAAIPGMTQLWEAISQIEEQFAAEQQNGKTLKVYYLRHLLIDLRKEQYALKALFQPTMHATSSFDVPVHEIDWFADSGYAVEPIDIDGQTNTYRGPADWHWHTIAEHTIDLANPVHIYHILDNYSALKHQIYDTPTSSTAFLLHAVECLVKKTHLPPVRFHILVRKIDHAPNDIIVDELRQKFGVDYATNYISTIWTKEICGAIAEQGQIDKDEWLARNHPRKWKTCIRCHKAKLRDNRFYALKRNAFDGLSPICRPCQRKVTK